jgi:hypothetical protein
MLGVMYAQGLGVAQSDEQAAAWYQKAADQGDVPAMTNLGYYLRNGLGVQWDEAAAMRWFGKAAQQGDPEAQAAVGYGYMNGLGGQAQDYRLAADWLNRAAGQGNEYAQYNLGILFNNGWGVQQDPARARRYFVAASRSSVPELAAAARRSAEYLSASGDSGPGRTPGANSSDSDAAVKLILVGLAAAAAVSLLSGSSNSADSSASSGGSASFPGSGGSGGPSASSSTPTVRERHCRQVPVETASSTQSGRCLTNPTSCGLSGATTQVCD